MNAQQLKNSILQEAILGRLVPQDPNDEPASALLARIRKEKEQLVKAGKLKKKDLEVKPISEDEIPFDIPESWEWVRLNDITELIEDCPHSTAKDEGKGYPLVRTPNVGFGKLLLEGVHRVSESVYNKRNERAVPQAFDLIYAREATAGNVAVIEEGQKVCLGQRTVLVRPMQNRIDSYWLAYFILSPYSYSSLVGKSTGTTVAHVNLSDFRPFVLPLPPLAEQHRIVAKIEELLPKVEEYGKAQEALDKLNAELPDRLKKSVLQEAIEGRLVPQDPTDEPASVLLAKIRQEKEQLVKAGKLKKKDLEVKPISEDEIPFEIPDSWEWCRVKSISFKIVDGDHNPPKGLSCDSGYYMLSSKNVNNDGLVELDSVRYLSYEDWEKCNERTSLKKGDVLLTTVGTLGRSCVYEGDIPYCFQRSVSIIQTFVFNYYLKYSFDCPFFQSLIDDKATGTAQRGFYLNQLEDAIIPLPPLAEQKRIVAKIEEVFSEIDKMKK